MYSAALLDHFEHPRNAGILADADARARVENPACGDILELFVRVRDGCVTEVRFRAKGCVPAMACGSALTGLLQGRKLREAARITQEDVRSAVDGLPAASGHAAQLAVDALQDILNQLNQVEPQ